MDKQEKRVLRLIKFVPSSIAIVFYLLISFMVINSQIKQGLQGIQDIRKNYIYEEKQKAKDMIFALKNHINYMKQLAEQNLREDLKNRVDEAYEISMNIYLQNRNRDKKEITKLIKDALRPIRFDDGRGYFFIYSMDLKNVLLPIAAKLEGKDFSNYTDIKGDFVVRHIAKLCKKYGNTFYTWYWRKPKDKFLKYKKIGYNIYFKPLGWFIGTGEYVVDFEKNLQKKILKEVNKIKYEKDTHLFLYSYNGTILTYLNNPRAGVGSSRYLLKDIVKIAKKGGGFLKYSTMTPQNTKKHGKKIFYISNIKGWHWVIGISEDDHGIEEIIKQRETELKSTLHGTLVKLAVIFVLMAILLAIILVFISKKSEKVFLNYKNIISQEMEKNKKQLLSAQQQNKMASMGEMLGNISHQWKQPLNTLGISIGKMILLEESGKLTKNIMLTSFNRMEKNIEYLSKTIDVFRDFFKPIQGIKQFNLKDEIKNVVYIIQDSFNDKKVELSYECKGEMFITGDTKKLEQVFINILNNAKDAIISNKIPKGKVSIKAVVQKKKVKISIQNNGSKISDEIKDKIFEPYFTTKTQSQGTGVGLYMSKIIIENNFQGELSFENKKSGVEFIITIPLS